MNTRIPGWVRQIFLAAVLLAASVAPVLAAQGAATLSAQDQADLGRIQQYLQSIKTLKADFLQTNQDGATAEGKVYLSRPGKMRFEYLPQGQMTIVSDGNYVAVVDEELHQPQFYPVDATPIWFLLREGIQLSGDVTVTKFEHAAQTFRITCVQTKNPESGSITLVFSDTPLSLRQWTVVDQQGKTTDVALDNLQPGVSIDPALFKLPDNPAQARPGNKGR